jgi:hypothetical protein
VARFDHNPTNNQSLGLLVEEQRTNLVTYSEDFSNAAWNKSGCTITANTIVAPNGSLTGAAIIEDATNSGHRIANTQALNSTVIYTTSFYVKAAGRSWATILIDDNSGNGSRGFYNLATGQIGVVTNSGTASGGTASMVAVGNGWYRCVLTCTPSTVNSANVRSYVAGTTADTIGTYVGTAGLTSIFIWGAQLEAGAFPTSYIPTVAATITRNADIATMTGTNFSSWYDVDEGTLYSEAVGVNSFASATRRYVELSDGTANERSIFGYANATSTRMLIIDDNNTQADVTVSSGLQAGLLVKMAATYKVNDFQQASNTTLGTADTSGTLPTVDRIFIGQDTTAGAAGVINGHIRKIAYYQYRLSNAQLQALTS